MIRYIHPNATISSNLLRVSAVLTVAGYSFASREQPQSQFQIEVILLSITILMWSAYLIRNGSNWIRWALPVLYIVGVIQQTEYLHATFHSGLAITGYLAILQSIVQIIAITLLFFPYTIPANEPGESTEILEY